ncbi:MAG: hypothetical protein ABL986_10065 [Vicinamibacterales bacterium]
MLRHTRLGLVVGLMGLVSSPLLAQVRAGASASVEVISVDREPRHRVVHSDATLRVLEVRIPGEDVTLVHRHDHDLLTVNIENGPTRTRAPGEEWSGIRAREVGGVNITEYTGKPSAHAVWATGQRAYTLTGVENLKPGGWTTLPPIQADFLKVALEGRSFRAYDVRLPASASTSHQHAVPVVAVLVEGGASVAGSQSPALSSPGQWVLTPAGSMHRITGTDRGAQVIEIEVR